MLTEVEGEHPTTTEGKIYGIDIGVKHFAVVTLGKKKFLSMTILSILPSTIKI